VKEKIQTHTWGIGGVPFDAFHGTLSVSQLKSYENEKTVQAKVGLLSISEWTQYSPHFKGSFLYVPSDMLTLTPYYPGSTDSLWYATSSGRILNNSTSQKAGVYPVVYLNPNTTVTKNGNILDNLSPVSIQVPDQLTDTQRNITLFVNDFFMDPNFYDNNVFSVSVEDESIVTASLKVEGETTPSKFAGQRNQAILTITPKRAEKYKTIANVVKAEELIQKLHDNEQKQSLEERIQELKIELGLDDEILYEKALVAINKAKKYPTSSYYYNKAIEAIELISDEAKRENLMAILNEINE